MVTDAKPDAVAFYEGLGCRALEGVREGPFVRARFDARKRAEPLGASRRRALAAPWQRAPNRVGSGHRRAERFGA